MIKFNNPNLYWLIASHVIISDSMTSSSYAPFMSPSGSSGDVIASHQGHHATMSAALSAIALRNGTAASSGSAGSGAMMDSIASSGPYGGGAGGHAHALPTPDSSPRSAAPPPPRHHLSSAGAGDVNSMTSLYNSPTSHQQQQQVHYRQLTGSGDQQQTSVVQFRSIPAVDQRLCL